jgi:alginate O-acetyltransferase complex protein AlgI
LLFNSLHFLIFLPLVVIAYYCTPARIRWILLLAASYIFYMCWKVEYILLIIASTIVDYYAGIRIEKADEAHKKKRYLFLSLFFNLGLLAIFKYYNFFIDSFETGLSAIFNIGLKIPYFDFLLPVGISFYTFQTLSYTIDIYKGRKKAERHIGIFALYVSFFPQLVAGPIERSTKLLPQLKQKFEFDYDRIISALRLIFFGFFQKIVVADSLAKYVNAVYNDVEIYSGFPLIFATFFFSVQIYNDFAGYSNIAIGSARLMGYDLMKNFNQPYLSKNIAEFWRKWHISIYSWFNDYLYNGIVLKYRRFGVHAASVGVIITFSLSGLWHGAGWTFIVWGMLHGLCLSLFIYTNKLRRKVNKRANYTFYSLISTIITFSFVNFTYVFFRANTINDAIYVIKSFFKIDFNYFIGVPVFTKTTFITFSIFFLITFFYDFLIEKKTHQLILKNKFLSYSYFIAVSMMIYIFGSFEEQTFVYFQF